MYDPREYWATDGKEANPFYQNIFALDKKLTEAKIPHDLIRLFDGWQVNYTSTENREGDFVIHFGSYGHELDLLEGYGFTIQDVVPRATVNKAFDIIKKYHEIYSQRSY